MSKESPPDLFDLLRTKHCPQCGSDLPIGAFNKNRARYDGRDSWCRDCFNRRRREKRRKRDPDEVWVTDYFPRKGTTEEDPCPKN